MYCRNCGNKLDDNAVVCPNCGTPVDNRFYGGYQQPPQYTYPPQMSNNTMAIIGFILSFMIPVAGLICSILGYSKSKKEGAPNQGLALAGIIISALYIGFVCIMIFGVFLSLIALTGSAVYYY